MEVSSVNQAYVFLSMILCGGICTAVFDVFRAIRRYKKSAGGVIALQDLIFWIIELCLVYFTAFKLNYAKVRVYEIIALVTGSVIYFITLSDYVIKNICILISVSVRIYKKLTAPFKKLIKLLCIPLRKIKNFVSVKSEIIRTGIVIKLIAFNRKLKSAFALKNILKKDKSDENKQTIV